MKEKIDTSVPGGISGHFVEGKKMGRTAMPPNHPILANGDDEGFSLQLTPKADLAEAERDQATTQPTGSSEKKPKTAPDRNEGPEDL